jgi:hypothetical protein
MTARIIEVPALGREKTFAIQYADGSLLRHPYDRCVPLLFDDRGAATAALALRVKTKNAEPADLRPARAA